MLQRHVILMKIPVSPDSCHGLVPWFSLHMAVAEGNKEFVITVEKCRLLKNSGDKY